MTNPDAGAPKPGTPPVKAAESPAVPAAAVPAPEAKPVPAKPPPVKEPAAPVGVGLTRAPKDGPTGGQLVLDAKSLAVIVSVLSVLVLFFAGTTLFLLLRGPGAVTHVTDQVPGMDGPGMLKPGTGTPAAAGTADKPKEVLQDVKIGEFFSKGDGQPAALPGHWPTFRGPKFDNIVHDGARLADSWPAGGPPVLWSMELGQGYAGATVFEGKVYLLDYDEEKKQDALRCLSLADGKEIWRRSYGVKIDIYHGYSRTVPAVTDKYVVSVGPYCHVMCVDSKTGDLKWGIDLRKEYGTVNPTWYTAQCPMIDGTTAVIAPGGKDVLMMGVDCETGKILWKTPNPKGWQMSHSSVMPTTMGGRKMYVYATPQGTLAVAADGANPGELLWSNDEWVAKVMSPAPSFLGDGLVYLTSGYEAGSALLKVSEAGGKFEAKALWKREPKEGADCEQQTPILHKGHLFMVDSPLGGQLIKQFVCMKADASGKVVWSSGKEKRFGLGPFILADDKFYILDDSGKLTMCRASTEKWEELGSYQFFKDGHDAWGPIAVAGTRMLLREFKKFICIDVGKGAQ